MGKSWRYLKLLLISAGLLTGICITGALAVRFAAPALSLSQLLYQMRYGLLLWRLCLYAGCAILWCALYRRLPVRHHTRMKRAAIWSLALLALSEISNLLQQESPV